MQHKGQHDLLDLVSIRGYVEAGNNLTVRRITVKYNTTLVKLKEIPERQDNPLQICKKIQIR